MTVTINMVCRLALRFAEEIRAWYSEDDHYVGDEQWNDMLFRNRTVFAERGHYGATQDDFDTNMAMHAAWCDVFPEADPDVGLDGENQGSVDLWNAAWALAAGNEFDDKRIKEEGA